MRNLPILDDIRIASPCNADWDDMVGDERSRFCGKCEKNVYNLSALSRIEAETLVNSTEGRMCVRFFERADGTILTADCPVGVEKKRLRARIWARISGAAASLALLVGLAGRATADVSVSDGNNRDGNATQSKAREKKGERVIVRTPQPAPANVKKPRPKQGGIGRHR
jgi:hypothetical protein